jgi:phosphatidylinositol alpha-1,6-mannosyltransferase
LYAHGEEILISLGSRKLRWLIPRLFNRAAAIIANSYPTKRLLEEMGVQSEKIQVIHPGVYAEAFQTDEEAGQRIRNRHGLQGCLVLLTVGRLQRRKGQDMVIRALPHILHRFPLVRYLIAGSGEEDHYLRGIAAELGIADKVIFAGEIPEEEKPAYYAACDVFVMPNRPIGPDVEGFGIVFLEAGAAGKPVIGGLSGGTADAIKEGITGLRVDGESTQAITDAVIALAEDIKKARTMGEQGRQRVAADFSWDMVVQHTREIAASITGSAC